MSVCVVVVLNATGRGFTSRLDRVYCCGNTAITNVQNNLYFYWIPWLACTIYNYVYCTSEKWKGSQNNSQSIMLLLGCHEDPNNHHSMSLLPVLSKVAERLANHQSIVCTSKWKPEITFNPNSTSECDRWIFLKWLQIRVGLWLKGWAEESLMWLFTSSSSKSLLSRSLSASLSFQTLAQ